MMRRMSSVLTLVAINILLSSWTAVAKPISPAISLDRPLKVASVTVTSDRAADGNIYLFTMTLPKHTGQSFPKLSVSFTEQNRDRTIAPIAFDLPNTTAFVGAPKAKGRAIGVQSAWIDETGVVWVQFDRPVPPQTTLTLALKLRQKPAAAMYDYGIAAYSPKAAAVFVGDGMLTIQR